jgi:hypothetical protein
MVVDSFLLQKYSNMCLVICKEIKKKARLTPTF